MIDLKENTACCAIIDSHSLPSCWPNRYWCCVACAFAPRHLRCCGPASGIVQLYSSRAWKSDSASCFRAPSSLVSTQLLAGMQGDAERIDQCECFRDGLHNQPKGLELSCAGYGGIVCIHVHIQFVLPFGLQCFFHFPCMSVGHTSDSESITTAQEEHSPSSTTDTPMNLCATTKNPSYAASSPCVSKW